MFGPMMLANQLVTNQLRLHHRTTIFLATSSHRCMAQLNRKPDVSSSSHRPPRSKKSGENFLLYTTSIVIAMFAASYGAVPLYKLYCQSSGKGGQAIRDKKNEKVADMVPNSNRILSIKFTAQTHKNMPWSFTPVQDRIVIKPGETALVFYRVKNHLDEPVIGIATYNVLPYEAGQYFNKIQCFCFEEQILQPKEDVFMPVLFYVDPEFCKDPAVANYEELVLSYVFFRSKDGDIGI